MEQLHGDDGENEVKQYVHDQYVYHVLQRVDDAIENRFELGHAFYGLQRSQHPQHSQRFDGRQIRADGPAAETNTKHIILYHRHAQKVPMT